MYLVPPLLIHVIVLVVARLGGGKSWMRGVDVVDEGGDKTGPFFQAQGNAFLRGFDGTGLRAVGLVPLSEVHALVARRHADIVTPSPLPMCSRKFTFSSPFNTAVTLLSMACMF